MGAFFDTGAGELAKQIQGVVVPSVHEVPGVTHANGVPSEVVKLSSFGPEDVMTETIVARCQHNPYRTCVLIVIAVCMGNSRQCGDLLRDSFQIRHGGMVNEEKK